MDFRECEISGQLVADGNKGQYWINEGAWTHLERVTPTPAGPEIQKLGTFNDVELATDEANKLDGE